MAITDYLKLQSSLIERELDRLVPLREGFNKQLLEAARYALLGGGKRLRPILTLATVQVLNGDLSLALTPACTLEMIHTYSMIHDDLPCMDDDDYRRGRLTLHKQYSEGHAVLTGDFLLTYAFEVLATHPLLLLEQKVRLIAVLAQSSGSEGMIGGQVMDLDSEGKMLSLDQLRLLHRHKTGTLITAAMEFGGILGHATSLELEKLRQFGALIGLAFQIIDDLLDVTSSQTKHGTMIASDILNQKSTYVSLLGIEEAKAHAIELYHQAIETISGLSKDTSLLVKLANFILDRQY